MRFVRQFPDRNIAVVAMDPTRRRSGGALLGDRIRMNSLAAEQVFMRSLATRRQNLATSAVLADVLNLLRYANFDLIVVETAGIGQSDSEIVDLVDVPMYVMTSEYGAASQLEKIDMLDFAELVALNKFEKRGAEDALRDVRKQWRRNRVEFKRPDDQVPVFPTIASRFNDPGVNRLFAALCARLDEKAGRRAGAGPSPIRARPNWSSGMRWCRRRARVTSPRSPTNGRRAATRRSSIARTRREPRQQPARGPAHARRPAAARARWSASPTRRWPTARRCRAARGCGQPTTTRSMRSAPKALALLRQWPAMAKSAHRRPVHVHGARQARSAATTTCRR